MWYIYKPEAELSVKQKYRGRAFPNRCLPYIWNRKIDDSIPPARSLRL